MDLVSRRMITKELSTYMLSWLEDDELQLRAENLFCRISFEILIKVSILKLSCDNRVFFLLNDHLHKNACTVHNCFQNMYMAIIVKSRVVNDEKFTDRLSREQ